MGRIGPSCRELGACRVRYCDSCEDISLGNEDHEQIDIYASSGQILTFYRQEWRLHDIVLSRQALGRLRANCV